MIWSYPSEVVVDVEGRFGRGEEYWWVGAGCNMGGGGVELGCGRRGGGVSLQCKMEVVVVVVVVAVAVVVVLVVVVAAAAVNGWRTVYGDIYSWCHTQGFQLLTDVQQLLHHDIISSLFFHYYRSNTMI